MSTENSVFPKYPKIQSIYKRDMSKKHKPFIVGEFTCPEFEYLQNNEWELTEKVDGTNIRVLWDGEKFRFGGRTDHAQVPAPLLEALTSMFVINLFDEAFGNNDVVVYGEGFGGKIQSGSGYSPVESFVVFDIRIGDWWIQRNDLEKLCAELDLPLVPLVGISTLPDAILLVKDYLQSYWDCKAEGVIVKPLHGIKARNGKRIITKIKCKDFRVCNSVG